MRFGLIPFRSKIRQGVYTGTIKARSSDQPGVGHTYTVSVQTPGGAVEFTDAAPQPHMRWSNVFDVDDQPFEIGTAVVVHVIGPDHALRAIIGTAELPAAGDCP